MKKPSPKFTLNSFEKPSAEASKAVNLQIQRNAMQAYKNMQKPKEGA